HQIRARVDTIDSQRLTEILVHRHQANGRGRVEQTTDTDRAVNGEAPETGQRRARLELQHGVRERIDFADIAEKIANAVTHRLRRHGAMYMHHLNPQYI